MLIFACIILLILAIAVCFMFGRKLKILSYKLTFIVLLVILIIMGFYLTKIIYKNNTKIHNTSQQEFNNTSQDTSNLEAKDLNAYKHKHTINVGTVANLTPWSYKKNNIASGYNIDLIKEAVKLMGKKIHIVVYDNEKDLYSALEQKQIDIIADFNLIKKDNNHFNYSIKIVSLPFVFIGNKKNFSQLIKRTNVVKLPYEDFLDKTILIEDISFFKSSLYDLLGRDPNVKTIKNSEDLFLNLEKDHSSVGFVEYFSFLYYKNTHPNSNLITISSLISTQDTDGLGFIVNSSDIALRHQLNIALNLLKRKGEMSNLSIKYFKEDVTL